MKVVIASATSFEIEKIKALIKKLASTDILQVSFHITGVGMLSSCFSITKLLIEQKPDLIIQVGIAGCFDTNMLLAKVVVVKDEFAGDMGVEENGIFKDLFDMKLMNEYDIPSLAHGLKSCAKEGDQPNVRKELTNPWLDDYNLLKLDEVTAITINEISTRKDRINQLINKYNPCVETMEGAALHYACLQMQVPFIQFRATSNYIGERDKTNWKLNDAITNLSNVMIEYLKILANKNV